MASQDYAMYIIVNNDLKMSKGKIASQVGHITELIAEKIMSELYENSSTSTLSFAFRKYTKTGRKKVILKGTEKDIDAIKDDKDAFYIVDAGRTEIPENSLTVVGFLPSDKNKERFKKFRLL